MKTAALALALALASGVGCSSTSWDIYDSDINDRHDLRYEVLLDQLADIDIERSADFQQINRQPKWTFVSRALCIDDDDFITPADITNAIDTELRARGKETDTVHRIAFLEKYPDLVSGLTTVVCE